MPHAPPEIFLVRHGETEWNTQGRFQGSANSELTVKGREQAATIGRCLAEVAGHAERMIVSPLGRTRETAAIIRSSGALPDPEYDNRVAEVAIGMWEGRTLYEIGQEWPGYLEGSNQFDWYFRAPDGERYGQSMKRVIALLSELDSVSLVVSHGLLGRLIRAAYAGLPRQKALELPVPHDVIWHLKDGDINPIKPTAGSSTGTAAR